MLLDYFPGGELIRHIRKSVFMSEEDTRFYLAEIILAVELLHSRGIIYRDLKPENILIDEEGHVKLIDFGFAKKLSNIKNGRAYTNCGTPGYCAPELLEDLGYDTKADIFSAGVIFYQLLTGRSVFRGLTAI